MVLSFLGIETTCLLKVLKLSKVLKKRGGLFTIVNQTGAFFKSFECFESFKYSQPLGLNFGEHGRIKDAQLRCCRNCGHPRPLGRGVPGQ